MEADLLVLLVSFITVGTRWYPQTLNYASHSPDFPFFVRASQHKHFLKLAQITGIESADKLREEVKKGHERLETNKWNTFHFRQSFWNSMNMDKIDTLK